MNYDMSPISKKLSLLSVSLKPTLWFNVDPISLFIQSPLAEIYMSLFKLWIS